MKSGRAKAALHPVLSRVLRTWTSVFVASLVAVSTIVASLLVMAAAGFLPLSGFEGRIIRSVEERMGPSWKVSMSSAVLTRVEGRSAVRIGNVLVQHSSGMNLRAPDAVLSYDPWALLTGHVRITGIDLRGVNARLGVDADGALVLDAGSEPVKLGKGIPAAAETSDSSALVFAVLTAVDLMAREEGELFALETARLSGAKLSLVDAGGNERIGFDNVNIRMTPLESAARRIDISARGASGLKDFSIELRAGENNLRQASLDVRQFEPSDIFALVLGGSWGGLDGLSLSGKAMVETSGPDTPLLARLDLNIAAGSVQMAGGASEAMRIDGGKLRLTYNNEKGQADIEELSLKSGVSNVVLSGFAKRSPSQAWNSVLTGKGVFAGEGQDPPVTVDQISLAMSGLENGDLELERLDVLGPSLAVTAKGTIRSFATNPGAELSMTIKDSDARGAIALWPVFVSPEVRKIISSRTPAGFIERLDLNMNFPPDIMRAAQAGLAVPDDSIKVTLKGRGVKFLVTEGLPLVSDAAITAVSTGRTLLVEASSARTEASPGRFLNLSEGSFAIDDTYDRRALGRAGFRTTGSIEALTALLASPVLRDFAPFRVEPGSIRGNVDLRSSISLPLADDVKPSEVLVVSNGQMTNVASDTLIRNEKLEGANLRASYDKGNLQLKGDGRVGGLPGQIEVRLDAKGMGEASLTAVLDQAARQKRGINLPGTTGPFQVRLMKALGDKAENSLRVEADLARASIDGLLPGWTKPAGKAGKLSFMLDTDKDGTDLDDFLLDSAPLLLKGKVSLGKAMAFESASFTSAKLSPGDDLRIDLAVEGGVTKATVRGKVFDVRPFLKLEGKDSKPEPDLDLDLNVPILTGFNSEAMGNAVVKLSRRQGEFRSLTLDGKIGRAPVTARLQRPAGASPGGQLVIETDDGGGLMRFYDLYRRAYGGNLIAQIPQGSSRAAGTMLYRDFLVRNEPALRRVLAEGQGGGIGGDRAVVAPRGGGNAGTEVAFTKLKVDFTRTPTRIDIQDAVIWGPLLGFTAQGSVDFGRDRIDVGGSFIPSYAFNNAFAQVPIFGRLLGGGQYEGLFAVNFRLSGSPSQPVMSVNPLSAIAPGILRRFVDPGGGSPIGDIPTLPSNPALR